MDMPKLGGEWRGAPDLSATEPEEGREARAGVRRETVSEEPLGSEVERFRHFCYLESVGPREVFSLLQQLCHRWLKPVKSSRAQVVDWVILEQFLAMLLPEMAGWLKECGTESCSQAVALAEGFLLSQAEEQRQQMRETRSWENRLGI
ncbi:zinc finger and SCAN domain-containing protein 9-like [Ahaetulla prasina]|uniref:zinc finger and SCAN domain-containing protein 9-like n=1 Tax=Ahaetulla prasina TaxID=499056 RepID=UPI002646FEA7|nr:zinc finger and SCAN domain-containing protein 9-like [Ahaetulla prasina]